MAGALRTKVFRPVLLSARNSSPRSRSTLSHLRCKISRKRAPVAERGGCVLADPGETVRFFDEVLRLWRVRIHFPRNAGGFRLAAAVALDLMPQTFHVEVVVTFDRITPVLS